MPNPFSINVVTSAGANLIAQATSTNQIVIVDALSGTQAALDASDLASKTAAFYDGVSGTIQASSATNNTAKVIARFGNAGAQAQIVRSVCIRGKLANQADSAAVIMAAMSDPTSEIYFPSNASPTQTIRFPFLFAVNADDDVETVYADGATMADLERFVSMYKAGNPTIGESQTIKGSKTFTDKASFKSTIEAGFRIVPSASGIPIGTNDNRFGAVTCNSVNVLNTIEPAIGNSGAIGHTNKRFDNIYVNHVQTSDITIPYGGSDFTINVQNGNFYFDSGIRPVDGGSQDLGDSTNRWRTGYIQEIQLAGSQDIKIYEDDGDIVFQPSQNRGIIVNNGYIQATTISGFNDTLLLDTVGGLFWVSVSLDTYGGTSLSFNRRELIYTGLVKDGRTLTVTTIDGSGNVITTGKYRLITGMVWLPADTNPIEAPAMRVE